MEENQKPMGLYIHIPFCNKKCDYCDFVSFSMSKKAQQLYLDALFTEIDLLRKEYEESSKYERSLMTKSLRYDVLSRDNYKCCVCGVTAKEGAKLHVDHIVPIAKGGKTVIENLQTLCENCNLGKSDKL